MLRKTHLALAISAAMLLNGCSDAPEKQTTQVEATDKASAKATSTNDISQNPFFQEWNTPFGAPPLGDIQTAHFLPAFKQAIVEHKKEIDAITENERPADFDNTIAAMELAGSTLTKVALVFGNLANTESNDEMQSLQREISPMLTRHRSEIRMNEALFKRVAAVYDNRKSALLNAEQTRLLERVYNSFVRSGAKLTGEQRAEFAKINERISALTTEFGQNALNDSRAFTMVLEESDLAGLPQTQRDAAAAAAAARDLPGKYVITLNRSSVQPFLEFSDRRDLREKAFKGWANRGDNDNEFDNKAIIAEIVELRAKRAQLLGYKHHSEYVLTNSMASKPETAMDLLLKVWEPAVAKAEQEREWIQELMAAEGVTHKLEPWDWRYYAEKVRKAKFDLDQGQIAEYFELNNMIEAQFYTAERLFGLKFVERTDIPVYNPVVRVWEVQDKSGKAIGLFYGDYYARSTKRSGAWMSSFRSQQKLAGDVKPLILNNMNLNKPAEGEPTLMSYSDAVTLFHEFGHALHGLLSNVTYPTLAGTSVPRDWVEFPAQLFEHFIAQPEMLKKFALHYKTNEPMPAELLERIKQAGTFNQGFATVEFTASALVDMAYHQLTDVKDLDVRAFENKVLGDYGKPEEIIMRHRSTHFGHIFAGGYSSAYYAYMWSEILDADGFDAFLEKKDIFDKETAERLYQFIYSRGDTLDYFEAYQGFRGRKPTTDALLRNRGLD
ncbi:M3 family metallopeptidase [Pseudoalteromonas luteoviolacea]|uniref:Zn-dependent oligopeptidase n=1 Tax=Pseudoalteromonas luteoviolacea (strain 2ta16) TaxID=1353533 RepID=V4J5H4_PSEL2|nr:M3 family metallopeptidase [Pseudoalteromonas luteoviolacea]ESP90602.1 Zn-dependent oligopeptidase [Pseudoalteromonas luteoviolacea 2ta16]KZN41825.1 peptidase M3 [Pseudoalteromonas luteoviolacea NCIMB 1944]